MENKLELYVNKKFDALKIIKMVFKRKNWGEKYTLYKNEDYEVICRLEEFNFSYSRAKFIIGVNETKGTHYYNYDMYIYTDREDYTLPFVNKLILRSCKSALRGLLNEIADNKARDAYPYQWMESSNRAKYIKLLDIEEDVEKLNNLDMKSDIKESLIDKLLDTKWNEYINEIIYEPRYKMIDSLKSDYNFCTGIRKLIEEIDAEYDKLIEKESE